MSGMTENMITKKAIITNPGNKERTRMVRLQYQGSNGRALWAEHPVVRFQVEWDREKSVIQEVFENLVLRVTNTTLSESQIICE